MAEDVLVRRFSRTERAVHWVHAPAFFALLATGLVLYIPSLSEAVGRRDLVKTVHLYVAVGWALAIVMVVLGGDRRALARTRREIERFDRDDLRWLAGWSAPQGRFNAGQKVHAVVQAAFAVMFAGSGLFLWLGERNTALRFPGSIVLHDALTYAATALVAGHLYLALIARATRPALRGITIGTVREAWAREQHPKWVDELRGEPPAPTPAATEHWPRRGVRRTLMGTGVLVVALSLWTGVRPRGSHPSPTPAPALVAPPVPPGIARGTALVQQAGVLDTAGNLKLALTLYAQAVRTLPGAADVRTAYASALARAGQTRGAVAQLREAVLLDPSAPAPRVYLGALLLHQGRRAESHFQLRRALALDPAGPTATQARQLLAKR